MERSAGDHNLQQRNRQSLQFLLVYVEYRKKKFKGKKKIKGKK